MIRLAIFAVLVIAFILLVRSFFGPSREDQEKQTMEMVKDPNCETYVPKNEAISKTLAGTTHYFCSEKCAEEYAAKED